MTFSIIIPTFNEEEYLPSLLKDIRAQTKQPNEIIIADAHSKDTTRAIAESYGARVVDGGLPGVGRNAGARVAHADVLIFLDADVRLPTKQYFAKTLKEFEDRSLDIATCDAIPTDESPINHALLKMYNIYAHVTAGFKPHAPGFCIFMRTKLHKQIHGFDEEVLLAEDHDYVQRASHFGSFGVLKSAPILTSSRRFERDGHFKTIAKYIACELHMSTLGSVKHDLFRYRFGYDKKTKKHTRKNADPPSTRIKKSP